MYCYLILTITPRTLHKKALPTLCFNSVSDQLFVLKALGYYNLNFHPPEIVSRCRDPQLQVGENDTKEPSSTFCYNSVSDHPLSPHDALKHHFTSPKTGLIFLQPGVL